MVRGQRIACYRHAIHLIVLMREYLIYWITVTFLSEAQLPGQPSEACSYQNDGHHPSKLAGEVNLCLHTSLSLHRGQCKHCNDLPISVCVWIDLLFPALQLKLSGMLVAAESQVTAGSLAGVPTAGTPNQVNSGMEECGHYQLLAPSPPQPGGDQGLPSYE